MLPLKAKEPPPPPPLPRLRSRQILTLTARKGKQQLPLPRLPTRLRETRRRRTAMAARKEKNLLRSLMPRVTPPSNNRRANQLLPLLPPLPPVPRLRARQILTLTARKGKQQLPLPRLPRRLRQLPLPRIPRRVRETRRRRTAMAARKELNLLQSLKPRVTPPSNNRRANQLLLPPLLPIPRLRSRQILTLNPRIGQQQESQIPTKTTLSPPLTLMPTKARVERPLQRMTR